ncbi:hypothetical protein D1BOALGB6SA_413 [Olavius sp. associated proteobacterium Delta 1]|nr:hypothetical protein D1BOALGB6SA_413 [Olavius sp. associated proteobacterium Delta 1]
MSNHSVADFRMWMTDWKNEILQVDSLYSIFVTLTALELSVTR